MPAGDGPAGPVGAIGAGARAGAVQGGGGRIRVLLVDDHVLVREGVGEILSLEQDIDVVGQASHSEEAVARVASCLPDVVLLDVEIPGRKAGQTVARMRQDSPSSRIIMLSMYDQPLLLRELISAGISGYLLKSVDRKELVAAIRGVYQSPERMVLSISRESLAELHRPSHPSLSEQQLTVLRLVAKALSNRQIATRMRLSEAAVKRHLHGVFIKLGAVSRIDAVNKATAAGLIAEPGEAE